jgi:hypothetical protein
LDVSGVGEMNLSFGIGEDPRILFAMVFAALIHEEDEMAILHNE